MDGDDDGETATMVSESGVDAFDRGTDSMDSVERRMEGSGRLFLLLLRRAVSSSF